VVSCLTDFGERPQSFNFQRPRAFHLRLLLEVRLPWVLCARDGSADHPEAAKPNRS
jgi:hypothetical protein